MLRSAAARIVNTASRRSLVRIPALPDSLKIEPVTPANADEATEFLMHDFRKSEPLVSSAGLSDDEYRYMFWCVSKKSASSGLSYCVRSEGKMIGVNLVDIVSLHGNRDTPHDEQEWSKMAPRAQLLQKLLRKPVDNMLIRVPPRYKKMYHGNVLSVLPEFKRQHIGERLTFHNLEKAFIDHNCSGVIYGVTNKAAQKMARKFQAKVVTEIHYADFLDQTGKQAFKPADGSESIQCFFLPMKVFMHLGENI